MQNLFETCTPREDVLTGNLPDTQFAADLEAVVSNAANTPAIYRDAKTFFTYTYPTQGLQGLAREVFGWFTGTPGATPNLRLETSFGGGKTHNLIALWHIARQPAVAAAAAGEWIDPAVLPPQPIFPVGLAGDKYGAAEVAEHNGVLTRTLWGEMAWQLGNYEVMREADEQRVAPAAGGLDRMVGARRVLILLDELPRYLRAAKGQRVAAGTLADQTLVFFHLLLGYAASHDNLVFVYSLSEQQDAYARERDEIVEQIAEARSVSARQERVVTPIAETEIAQVLRRRLFLAVEDSAAAGVASTYVDHLRRSRAQGAPLPPDVGDPGFRQRMEASYPFHPELLETLYRKTSSFPNFQWARGTLRLLAATVRGLWRDRPADAYLIQTSDIDLSSSVVRDELTSRIDRPKLVAAIAEDVWSEHGNAHAQEFDAEWSAKGYPFLSRRVAQAVFLHSLVYHTAQKIAGADPAEAHLACGRPGLPFDLVEKALSQIEDRFSYADFDGRRYAFHEEPTIKKLIAEATGSIGRIAAKDALRMKAKEVFAGPVFRLEPFPSGPESVPDEGDKPTLVLMDFDHVEISAGSAGVPSAVEEIFQRAGENRRYRGYQNNLVVLAVDADKKESMIEAARKVKGIESLIGSEEQRRRLAGEPLKKLQQAADNARLEYRVAITNAYCHLFYRSLQDGGIEHYELPAQDSSDAKKQQQADIRTVLGERGKALTKALAPAWVLDRIWTDGSPEISLEALKDAFARKPRAYLLFDEGLAFLRSTVRDGVTQGAWVYVDEQTKTPHRKDRPPSAEQVRFGNDARLVTPEEADKRYPVEPPLQPPQPPRVDPKPDPRPGGFRENQPGPWGRSQWRAEAEGPAPKALQEVHDRLAETGGEQLTEVELAVVGGENTRRLLDAWSAVANAFADATVTVEHEMAVHQGDEDLSLTFQGSARHFARLHSWLRAALVEPTADDHAVTKMLAAFKDPLPASDPRFLKLAKGLDETYGCGPIGVKAR